MTFGTGVFPRFRHDVSVHPSSAQVGSDTLVRSGEILIAADLMQDEPGDDALARLIDEARAGKDWRQAIGEIYSDPLFVRYIASDERLVVLDALPLAPHQAILEVGPGYGQMSAAIAKQVASLDTIEASVAQARFCAIRCAQEGLDNVRVVAGGKTGLLPYADASFDGVVMNLVFEWCAYRADELGHEAVQRNYLSEIARVLKPGGFLFLSTKNRYSIRLLAGGRDEHAGGLRFGSALPRRLARLLAKEQRGFLHSFPALQAMIKRAGFSDIKGYWATPDMRWPTRLVPLDAKAVAKVRGDKNLPVGPSRFTDRLMRIVPAAWVRYLTPGLTFLARRTGQV